MPDQVIRIINAGTLGTPLTSPVGDICGNICLFNNDQEMIACCTQRITPNELDSASVGTQLTFNPLTSVVPPAGVIKIASFHRLLGGAIRPTAPPRPTQHWGLFLARTCRSSQAERL